MTTRTYNQYCAAARALDLVGDRWTLLLIRELLLGPRRYSDLQHGLPGIGTNLLAARLKMLEEAEIVRKRTLPRPAASTVYELTERGQALEPIVVGLARWGLELLGAPDSDQEWRPEWSVVAMRATFRPEASAGINESYQFWVDDEPFWATVRDGVATTGRGEVEDPAMVARADADTFLSVASGEQSIEAAIESGRYPVSGDEVVFARCAAMFALPGRSD